MKNLFINKYILLLFAVTLFASCRKALEKYPLDAFSEETFWTSENNAMLALTAIYRGDLRVSGGQVPTSWWSPQALIFMEAASDNAYQGQGNSSGWNKLTSGELTATIGVLSNYWTSSYKTIARCNDFLENIGDVNMDESRKNRMIAEVRFIRACQYFYMSQHFGSVPLVAQTLSPDEANNVTKASIQEIVDFVISEYQASVDGLPRFKDIPSSETGRVCKQACLAFLGRVQMARGLYDEAAATYETIINFGDNIIDPDYESLFIEENENSSENIFSIQYVSGLFGNSNIEQLSPRSNGGFTLINPLGELMESYQFIDGTEFSYTDSRYDYKDLGKNRDPRLSYTMYYDNAPFRDRKISTHPDSTNSTDRIGRLNSKTGFLLKKFIDESFMGDPGSYGGNIPVIRYAEVLLSYLEAKLEAGHPIDLTLLNATINKVRNRASVNMPPITETSPDLLRPILRNERRVELAMEGIRLWDLLRWGVAAEELNDDFYGHPYPVSRRAIQKNGSVVDPYSRWYVMSRAFREGVDELWPIPQNEVNINPKLGE